MPSRRLPALRAGPALLLTAHQESRAWGRGASPHRLARGAASALYLATLPLLCAALLAACSPRPTPDDPRVVYDLRCAPCHGPRGKGDGPSASSIRPPPRDLSDPAFQARATDDYLKKVIVNGGLGVGLSTRMPGSPDLASRPRTLDGLVVLLRSFSAPEGR